MLIFISTNDLLLLYTQKNKSWEIEGISKEKNEKESVTCII